MNKDNLESRITCIYGNEKVDEQGKELIEELTNKKFDDYLRDAADKSPDALAEEFIEMAIKLDLRWNGNDKNYYTNVAAILSNFANKDGFYEALLAQRQKYSESLDAAKRAQLIVLGQ